VTVTLTYDNTLSRVRITATSLGSAVAAHVERSIDQVTWTTVRGGDAALVSGGTLTTLDDYEFIDAVPNYYRVTYADTMTFVASGAAAHAANASVTPTIPTGSTTGDLMLILAATWSSGFGTPNTPTGYQRLIDAANLRLFGKIHTGSESNPTVSFTGTGDATMAMSAQMATLRHAQLAVVDAAGVLNALAQNIIVPDMLVSITNALVLAFGWKQDDWTSTTSPAGFIKIGEPSTTLGSDQGITWARQIQTNALTVSGAIFTITGGATAVSRGVVTSIPATTTSQQSSITPVLDGIWLKSLGRPFLNRQLACDPDPGTITRDGHGITSSVIGRSLPIGTSAVRGARQLTINVSVPTIDDRIAMNVIIGTGDPLFIHAPARSPLPTMYVVVDDTNEERPLLTRGCQQDWRRFILPFRESAAPGSGVIGSSSTWQTVIDTYVDWSTVLANKATWLALIDLVGNVSEVIVP
jgi:hypothetical protein